MITVTYYAGRALSPVVLEVDAKDDEATIRLLETVERRFGTVNDPERDKRFGAIIAERERVAKLADAPLAYKEKPIKIEASHIPGSWTAADREEATAHVRATSRAAYAKAKRVGKLSAQQGQILDWLRENGNATRQEIARGAGIPLASACGRIDELRTAGIVADGIKRRCNVTGETALEVTVTS